MPTIVSKLMFMLKATPSRSGPGACKKTARLLAAVTASTMLLVAAAPVAAQDLASFEKRTTVKVLPNGLTVIVIERPVAPVFSYFTHVDVGGAQEAMGQTGMAHMFEHMAFKGTDRIGTKN